MGKLAKRWLKLNSVDRRIFLQKPMYLLNSEDVAGVKKLLADFDFLSLKVSASNNEGGGVQPLIGDYNLALPILTAGEENKESEEALRLIQGALRLSAPMLVEDRTQLATQLWGRLISLKTLIIQSLLKQIEKKKDSWLRPLTPILTVPGGPEIGLLTGHTKSISALAVTKDGKKLLSGSLDGTLRLWDVEAQQETQSIELSSGGILCCAIAVNGQSALAGTLNGNLYLVDLNSGLELQSFVGHSEPVGYCAFLSETEMASAGCWDRSVFVWKIEGPSIARKIFVKQPIGCCAFAVDTQQVVTGGENGSISYWDLKAGLNQGTRKTGADLFPLDWLAITSSGDKLLSGSGREINLWLPGGLESLQGSSSTGAIAANGDYAIFGSLQGDLWGRNLRTGKNFYLQNSTASQEISANEVTCCAISGDGKFAFSGLKNGAIRVWDITSVREDESFSLADSLAWRTGPPMIHLTNTNFSPELYSPFAASHMVTSCTLSADGNIALVGYSYGLIRVVDFSTGRSIGKLRGHSAAVTVCTCLLDSRYALSAASDETLRLWDLQKLEEVKCMSKANFPGWTFSHKGDQALSQDGKGLLIWDLQTGKATQRIEEEANSVTTYCLSADTSLSAVGWEDGTLEIWNLTPKNKLHALTRHSDKILLCAISGNGERMISFSIDKTVCTWIKEGRIEQSFLAVDPTLVLNCQLSMDGTQALIVTKDGLLAVWDTLDGSCVATYCADYPLVLASGNRNLTKILAYDMENKAHYLELCPGGS